MTNLFPPAPILLVDDEEQALLSLETVLWANGLTNTRRCGDGRSAIEAVRDSGADLELVLLDLLMPSVSGQEVLEHLVRVAPQVPVLIITGLDDVERAVECMRQGAFDYLVKPLDPQRLIATMSRALEVRQLRRQNERLSQKVLSEDLEHPEAFRDMVTVSRSMHSIFRYCEAVATGREPVLITGETGVGKELMAHALHRLSRPEAPFVAVNVAGLDDFMFSDALFGHVRGAFTNAVGARSGFAEKAQSGTLFLDEIGDLNEASQVKLLRLLQEREFQPLGSDQTKVLHARVLTSTHQALDETWGKLRQDLLFRLKTHHIHIPALRERPEDIGPLVERFAAEAAGELGLDPPRIHPDLPARLAEYPFPGNIRELRGLVYDAFSRLRADTLHPRDFQSLFKRGLHEPNKLASNRQSPESSWTPHFETLPSIEEMNRLLVQEAMRRNNNNQTRAAAQLGLTRQALAKRLKKMSA